MNGCFDLTIFHTWPEFMLLMKLSPSIKKHYKNPQKKTNINLIVTLIIIIVLKYILFN